MKKYLLTLILAVSISFGCYPGMSFAIEAEDPKFEAFLETINWNKGDYVNYLESKDWLLADFDSVEELGTPLTEESVQSVLQEFDLTRDELNALLVEFGDIEDGEDVLEGTYIIFTEDLMESVDFYINWSDGTPIDETNLQQLVDDYGFESVEALEQFLNEYDDSIENYEYIEDLELSVDYYLSGGEEGFDEMYDLFQEIGLTDEELEKLFDHFLTLDLEDPAFYEKLIELSDRMVGFEQFESAEELSASQIAEVLDIFSDMLDLFQLDTKYFLVKDGEKKSISFETMMTMETSNGYDLLVEVYNKKGDFLADILLTAEMVGSELIQETGKDLKEAEEIISESPPKALKVRTIKGGKLPDTASDYMTNTLAGLAIMIAGFVLFRRLRVRGNE